MRGRYASVNFVVERLAGTRAVNSVGIAGAGKPIVDDVRLGCVGEQARLRIDAGGSVEYNGPAVEEFFFTTDAETGLLQVVGRDQESMLIAVAIDQRRAFVVVSIFRQAVTDPADANIIRAVQSDAVPGEGAICEGELASARAGVRGLSGGLGARGDGQNRQAQKLQGAMGHQQPGSMAHNNLQEKGVLETNSQVYSKNECTV